MMLMSELKKQMQAKHTDELVELLCKPDADLTLSHFVDLSSMPESPLLKTAFTDRPVVHAKLVRRMIAPMILEKIGPAEFLDDSRILKGVDKNGMLRRIEHLYGQMNQMNKVMVKSIEDKGDFPPARRILAFGLGGSASGPLLAREIIHNQGYSVPFDIHTSYPESFHGIDDDTMVVVCSYSGNTEETLHAFDFAQRRTENIVIISLDGKLQKLANGYRFIKIPDSDIEAPRESIGYWFTAFLFIVSSLKLAKREDGTVFSFDISSVEDIRKKLGAIDETCAGKTPFSENPAKQDATYFLFGTISGGRSAETDWQRPREPVFLLDGSDRAIGKRLANQFGETVEHPITLLLFAEDAHNEIESVATFLLEDRLYWGTRKRSYVYVSCRAYETPQMRHNNSRAVQRIEVTLKTLFEKHDVGYRRIETDGESLLERKLCLLKRLDYARLYASILLGTDPLPTELMEMMKKKMDKVIGEADRQLLKLLVDGSKLPLSRENALRDEEVKSFLPALRETIIDRLIQHGYLVAAGDRLELSSEGKTFLTDPRLPEAE
jgi:glucose/mannose-6-phosphate isomerase